MIPCIFRLRSKAPLAHPATTLKRCLRTRIAHVGRSTHAQTTESPLDIGSTKYIGRDSHPSPAEGSRRSRRRSLRSPSPALQAALRYQGLSHLVATVPAHKTDLSNLNITYHDKETIRRHLGRNRKAEPIDEKHMRMTPILIIARAMLKRPTEPASQATLLNLGEDELAYLQSRGWDEGDVRLWLHVITESNADIAADSLRTCGISDHIGGPSSVRNIPIAVILAFLRRPSMSPAALRDIILCVWRKIHGLAVADSKVLSHAWFIVIVRLIRHARQTWPDALVTVTAMFTHVFHISAPRTGSVDPRLQLKLRRLTYLSNKVLKLLALPSSGRPFLALPYHERAQFDLLGWMAGHDPPLTITREGYKAFISIQLAHRKTPQEQDWSQLKVKSWPPWKEDKTGLDSDKGFEYGRSRALQAIKRAAQAGYGGGLWERSAQILAGWDIDMSPTIQTRAFLLHKYLSYPRTSIPLWPRRLDASSADGNLQAKLWAARITATRTIQEAWACFLEHKDQKLPLSGMIYDAMLRKLLMQEMLPNNSQWTENDSETRPLEPGDHTEVLPPPISPKEMTYVHTEPPTADQFALEVRLEGLRIRDDTLALLISRAKSFDTGFNYALWQTQYGHPAIQLTGWDGFLDDLLSQSLAKPIFCAIIKLFCAYPSAKVLRRLNEHRMHSDFRDETAFPIAVRLVRARHEAKSQEKAVGYILSALKNPHIPIQSLDTFSLDGSLTPSTFLFRYRFAQTLLRGWDMRHWQQKSATVFAHTYLVILERAVRGALQMQLQEEATRATAIPSQVPVHDHNIHGNDSTLALAADEILSLKWADLQCFLPATTAAGLDKDHEDSFKTSASSSVHNTLPRLLSRPDPATLHIMIRILGHLRDYQGILDLFEWMLQHESEVRAAAIEPRNGRGMLKRCLTAARVFFERSWEEIALKSHGATDVEREQLMKLMENSSLFGEWPDEERVWRYLEKGKNRLH